MPFITISRMYGSGGSEVAAKVAADLGWVLYDNAVIDAVAERSGLSRAAVTEQDERVPSLVERLAAAMSMGTPESMPAVSDRPLPDAEEEVVRVTRRVIEEAVQREPAVFVGRGAQCLLAERTDALHVFCYAEHPALVRYAVEHHSVPAADAERAVSEMNRQRERYVRRHWQRDWRAPENYHLCLNTAALGIAACSEMVVRAAKTRFG